MVLWLQDPSQLCSFDVVPNAKMSLSELWNTITRIFILVLLVVSFAQRTLRPLLSGLACLVFLYVSTQIWQRLYPQGFFPGGIDRVCDKGSGTGTGTGTVLGTGPSSTHLDTFLPKGLDTSQDTHSPIDSFDVSDNSLHRRLWRDTPSTPCKNRSVGDLDTLDTHKEMLYRQTSKDPPDSQTSTCSPDIGFHTLIQDQSFSQRMAEVPCHDADLFAHWLYKSPPGYK